MTTPTELRIITESNGRDLKYVQTVIQSFEVSRPDVKVVLVQAEDSYGVMEQFHQEGADLLHIREGGYSTQLRKGVVQDLLPYLKNDPVLKMDDFYQGALMHPMWEGQLAALPVVDVAVPQIFYNKKWFAEAKVPFPTNEWTEDQFLDAAIRLTRHEENQDESRYGFYIYPDVEFLEPFLMRRGGRHLSEDGTVGKGYADSEIAHATYQWIVDLYRKHRVAPMPGIQVDNIFRSNRFAMIYDFSWHNGIAYDPELSETYGVVGLPHAQGGRDIYTMYSTGYGIPVTSKQSELAWELLKELALPSSEEARRAYWGVPITNTLAKELGRIDNPWWGPALYAMERIEKNAYLSNQVWNLSRQQMNQDIERMIKGEAGVEETLSRWAEIVS
ncbi:extracellular solute-binding protein [Paenibacillus sp. ISL-20]|uniref:extracellular solute-binding protein n=1 Tax=Paenibacillus sp. ISL-20 TaxID=2819163 RepID=UPI001BE73F57|nr:extracellular solute-binding protein [Paenibacillus sp. ISL-20]